VCLLILTKNVRLAISESQQVNNLLILIYLFVSVCQIRRKLFTAPGVDAKLAEKRGGGLAGAN
jgi:hypothetical protein